MVQHNDQKWSSMKSRTTAHKAKTGQDTMHHCACVKTECMNIGKCHTWPFRYPSIILSTSQCSNLVNRHWSIGRQNGFHFRHSNFMYMYVRAGTGNSTKLLSRFDSCQWCSLSSITYLKIHNTLARMWAIKGLLFNGLTRVQTTNYKAKVSLYPFLPSKLSK